ncbi:MAG: DUF4864 domain-containing protein [Alphaproteobacteria bacterium]
MSKISMCSFALAAIGFSALAFASTAMAGPANAGVVQPIAVQPVVVQSTIAIIEKRNLGEKSAMRGVVRRQIAAFRDREVAVAFSLAAPNVQVKFGDALRFFGFLARNYSPVFDPKSVFFDGLEETSSGPVQRVLLTGPTGRQWLAQFTMVRLGDGQWRVADCQLTLAPGQIA